MHIVKYRESERGWGGEVWYVEKPTKELAVQAVKECMENLPATTPDYYIIAEYQELDHLPRGYKF